MVGHELQRGYRYGVKRESPLARFCYLRRRVHASWKIVLGVAVFGGLLFASAGLITGVSVFFIVLAVLVFRPLAEIYFSHRCRCPHCGGDVFLVMCEVEQAEGVERGIFCPYCRQDAATIAEGQGILVDVD